MKKTISLCLALVLSISFESFGQSNVDYCNKAIDMMNKNNMDSCNYYLKKANYFSGNYVDDKSECFTPFNSAKVKKYMGDLEKNPKDGNAAGSVAIANYWLKNYDQAVKYYELAINVDSKTEWYYTNLAYLYSSKLNNLAKAEETTDLFLKNNPESDNYTNAGAKCFENKNYEKAIVYFKKALVGSVIDHKAYNNIGMAFLRIEKCDSSIFYSSKAIDLNPQYTNAADNLVEAYNCQLERLKKNGDMKAFVDLYNKMKEKFASSSSYQLNIPNRIKYELTKYYDGIQEVVSKPTSDGYFKLSEYLMSEKDFDGAISSLQSAIKLNPKNGEANFNLGYIYMEEKKDYKKALQLFNTALPNLSSFKQESCLFNTGLCYQNMGDNTNAIATFKKVLAKNPTDKDTHYRLYMIYEKSGDKVNADYHKRRS